MDRIEPMSHNQFINYEQVHYIGEHGLKFYGTFLGGSGWVCKNIIKRDQHDIQNEILGYNQLDIGDEGINPYFKKGDGYKFYLGLIRLVNEKNGYSEGYSARDFTTDTTSIDIKVFKEIKVF